MSSTHAQRSHWTEERAASVRRKWDDGWSASQIANAINKEAGTFIFSRNAILGKAHRDKWPARACGGAYQHRDKPRRVRRKTQQLRAVPKTQRVPLKRVLREEPPVVQEPSEPDEMKRVPFLDRKIDECSFIVYGEGVNAVCCGNRALGTMCDWHQRFCHIAGSARRQRPKEAYAYRCA